MSESTMLAEAFELMLLGMGTVFVFLTVLVIVTSTMSKIVMRFAPVEEPKSPAHTPANANPQGQGDTASNQTLLSVVTAAIFQHRNRNK